MAADVRTSLKDWSTTVGSNLPTGSTSISTNLDDNLCQIQATVRYETASRDTIASATTCDLGTKDAGSLDITGTTTITSFGTVSAGIRKLVTFSGALTLTHNGTSLKLPGSANITTAAGDTAMLESLGSGNWNCLFYQRKSSVFPAALTSGYFLTNNGTSLSWGQAAVSISGMAAATTSNTIANAAYAQSWGWVFSSSAQTGLTLTGQSSGGSGNGHLLTIDISNSYPTNTFFRIVKGATTPLSFGWGDWSIAVPSSGGQGFGFSLTAGAGSGASVGGDIAITAGSADSGAAGSITLTAGNSTSSTDGYVKAVDASGSLYTKIGPAYVELYGNTKVTNGLLILDTPHATVPSSGAYDGHPTIASGGGTGAVIAGSKLAFEVTFGAGSPTSVTVTNSQVSSTSMLYLSGTQSGQTLHYAVSSGSLQVLSDSAFSSGTKVSVLVINRS